MDLNLFCRMHELIENPLRKCVMGYGKQRGADDLSGQFDQQRLNQQTVILHKKPCSLHDVMCCTGLSAAAARTEQGVRETANGFPASSLESKENEPC